MSKDLKNKKLIPEIYVDEYNNLVKKYGRRTFLFMMVGDFYEAYSLDDAGPDLNKMCDIMNITKTRKNNKKHNDPVTYSNPYMCGVNKKYVKKQCEVLVNNGYTVILIDQITNTNKKKGELETRKISSIFTPSTFINYTNSRMNTNLICIYITEESQLHGHPLTCCGLTAIDLNTNHVIVHEVSSNSYDKNHALDETARFINTIGYCEILIYYDAKNIKNKIDIKTEKMIVKYLEIDSNKYKFYEDIDSKYTKIKFQNEILTKIYPDENTLISPIEQMGFDRSPYIVLSLIMSLDYLYDKDSSLLKLLKKPKIFTDSVNHLSLGNNAMYQLNILSDKRNDICDAKYDSLFSIVNNTSTRMGERYLKSILLQPLVDKNELEKIYDNVDILMNKEQYKTIEKHLQNIQDVEKILRKMCIGKISPYDSLPFFYSVEKIIEIVEEIKKNKKLKKFAKLDKKTVDELQCFLDDFTKTFDFKNLENFNELGYDANVFNTGINKDIDKLISVAYNGKNVMSELQKSLSIFLDLRKGTSGLRIKESNKEGLHLSTSKTNGEKIIEKLKEHKKIKLSKGHEIASSTLKFTLVGKTYRITTSELITDEKGIDNILRELRELNREKFITKMLEYYEKYCSTFEKSIEYITKLDYYKSNAKTASIFKYTRPIIVDNKYSYLKAEKLCHPIIKELIDVPYTPHTIELGHDDLKGILLFSINSAGKSSLMKATGIAIIMAQSGLYVPAEKFTFTPYHALLTRITGNDDIFKGMSSFTLEMTELNAIMKRADKYTLVIGDEICRGTEHISGTSIVATAIIKLAEKNASFIFATHLHELMQIKEINALKNVKPFYLKVQYDHKNDLLIYDRNLAPGSGEQIYGIVVAQYIIKEKEFVDTANKIKNELLESYDSMISGKTSRYNSDIVVSECEICHKKDKKSNMILETHHINHQKDCENGVVKNKKHLKKNDKGNLIVICQKCHDKIHNNEINVGEKKMTSKGKRLINN